jgi:hypothetical protein
MRTYAMSCFDLSKSLCEEICSMIATFWGANQDNEKKLHWLSWEVLTRRKEKGIRIRIFAFVQPRNVGKTGVAVDSELGLDVCSTFETKIFP